MSKKQMKLAAYLVGTGMHVASWKHPKANPKASIDVEHYKQLARVAENGKFDIAFIADSLAINEQSHPNILNRFDPIVLITALAEATSKIGIVATASTTYSEPYSLARQFASVDHISRGRAGWNLVTTGDATGATAQNFGRETHEEHDVRYERAEEFIDVVQGLWDSWEDDAFVLDKEKGTFFNEEKMHQLNYKGTFFSVRGPLNIARSVQGQPVIVQAGSSPSGQRLAARTAEVVFIHKDSKEEAKKYYRSLKSQMKTFNRHPESLSILQGISPIIGRTEAEANEKYTELQHLLSPYEGLQFLSGYMGNIDFTKYPLNMLASEISFPKVNGIQSQFDEMKRIMKEEKLTVGDLYYRFVGAGRKDAFVGTPQQIADEMERWVEEGAADGFMLQCPLLPEGLEDFVQYVVPLLQEKGIYRHEYEGTTLREHLGFRKPRNRYDCSIYKGSS